jgi:hypothetical protein
MVVVPIAAGAWTSFGPCVRLLCPTPEDRP